MFRLAILLWRLRRGAHPFGAQPDAAFLAIVDRLLLRCLDPSPGSRPTAREVLGELGAA